MASTTHGEGEALPHALIGLRQDLIDTHHGAEAWATAWRRLFERDLRDAGSARHAGMSEPAFTIGIEEEYLLVDRASRDLASDPPPEMLTECQALLPSQVSPEFLRTQIEVGTTVCSSLAEARAELAHLRRAVAEVAGGHGLAPIAASTHPFAQWHHQKTTDRERYTRWPAISRRRRGGWSSAACMSMSGSTIRSCAST